MNRIDRLTAIIIYLQGRSRVKIEDLAERYKISSRTVYRDLRALQEAGVPIGSESGQGYFIVRGYHMPPVMFDKNEVAALLAGERLMQKWSDTKLGESYGSALDKIRSVLRYKDKEYLDTLDHHIKALPYQEVKEVEHDHRAFTFLQNAIVHKKVIGITYHAAYKDEITTRDIEPLGLILRRNHWYVAAWCRLRVDYRIFRVDRIKNFHSTGNEFDESSGHSFQEFSETSLRKEEDLQEVKVLLDNEISRYVGDQKYYYGWVSEQETGEGLEMTFLTSSIEYFARWLLTWGDGVKIIAPEELKIRVRELSKELHRHYVE